MVTPEQVQDQINALISDFDVVGRLGFVILPKPLTVPEGVNPNDPKARYCVTKTARKIEIYYENIRDEGDLARTLRHEVFGHFALDLMPQKQHELILRGIQIVHERNQPDFAFLWDNIQKRYPEADNVTIAEELFAEYVGNVHISLLLKEIKSKRRTIEEDGRKALERCSWGKTLELSDLSTLAILVTSRLKNFDIEQQLPKSLFERDRFAFKQSKLQEDKKPFHETVAEQIVEQLKKGTAPWQKPWKPGELTGLLPMNPTTGKRYHGINVWWLHLAGRSDPRWMTYKQAESIGAQVRKGEKGRQIEYWQFTREIDVCDDNGNPVVNAEGKQIKKTVRLTSPRVYISYVFNAEQIDGLPLYVPPKPNELTWNIVNRAEDIIKASNAVIKHLAGDEAYYFPAGDHIVIPEREQFESAENYYAILLHELGHWTGHETRLNRDMKNPFGTEAYAREELRAEIASLLLAESIGIGHDFGNHAAYVQNWIRILEKDPREIFRAAAAAEEIRSYIMAFEHKKELTNEQQQGQVIPSNESLQKIETEVPQLPTPEVGQRIEGEVKMNAPKQAKELVYLDVPFKEKDDVRRLGARWDAKEKKWFVPTGTEPAKFSKWFIKTAEPQTFKVGDKVNWKYEPRGGYAYVQNVAGIVSKIGEKRVLIEVLQKLNGVWEHTSRWVTQDKLTARTNHVPNLDKKDAQQATKNEPQATQEGQGRQYLAVPFEEHQEAKKMGARWDKAAKSWYVGDGADPEALSRWLPGNTTNQPTMSPREEFAEFLRDLGLEMNGEHPIMDGEKHRVRVINDKPGAVSGFYVGHLDGHPAGFGMNHKNSESRKWKAKGYSLTDAEKAELAASAAAVREERANKQQAIWEKTAKRIEEQINLAYSSDYAKGDLRILEIGERTPYLIKKGLADCKVHPHAFTDKSGEETIVELSDVNGKTWSLEYIKPDGTKRYAKNSRKEGCFLSLGDPERARRLIICEGYATALTISDATIMSGVAIAAFDAGNVVAVAKALREEYPETPIIIAGDDDATNDKNPGRRKAEEAAKLVGGVAVFPKFRAADRKQEPGLSDFNDLMQKSGLDEVKEQIRAAFSALERKQKAEHGLNHQSAESKQSRKSGLTV